MFEKKKIFILGFARSGKEAARVLIERGNEVLVNDVKPQEAHEDAEIKELEQLGVTFVFGSHPDDLLDESFDYLIKNPGVPIDHKYVLKARELGIPVINEVEMAYQLLPHDVTIIAVTGTNGKTTTTSLIYELLKTSYPTYLAGNIGYPLSSVLGKIQSNDVLVMEVSCQQLENLVTYRPHIAVMTNLSEAHIDFFHSYEAYKKVKAKLFQNQTREDIAILNIENQDVIEETKHIASTIRYFSSANEINGCYLKDNAIYYYDEKVMDCDRILLRGKHNLENCMAAVMVAKEMQVSNENIEKVLSTFRGVEHRLELVATIDGVKYYNDTEATNIKCTQIALSSFSEPIVLILGGMERGQDFNELAPYLNSVKAIAAIGTCRRRAFNFAVEHGIEAQTFETLKDAFPWCVEEAVSGGIVLLSPASASWDQYKQCEDRGAEFKQYVEELKKEKEEKENEN